MVSLSCIRRLASTMPTLVVQQVQTVLRAEFGGTKVQLKPKKVRAVVSLWLLPLHSLTALALCSGQGRHCARGAACVQVGWRNDARGHRCVPPRIAADFSPLWLCVAGQAQQYGPIFWDEMLRPPYPAG